MSPSDTTSTNQFMDVDDEDSPRKRLRTADVEPDIDPSPPTGLNRPDYSGGRLVSMCSSFFPDLREDLGRFLVDKTKLIEDIVNSRMRGKVDLVLRPRRCGKSTMLQMMKSFFGIPKGGIDLHHLFSGLYIADKQEICRDHMGKYAVIFLDFQTITGTSWTVVLDSFKYMVSCLYEDWRDYLWDSLSAGNQKTFQSLIDGEASDATLRASLELLSRLLAKKSGRKVIVFIDEYDAPNNRAYEYGFFKEANEFFGRGVLPALLKMNEHIAYGLLAGVTPTAKTGWYSGLTNIQKHPLHEPMSVFAAKLMFTEAEVLKLRELSGSQLDPKDLKEHYNSYLTGGQISVYNPVSIMSAFEKDQIKNYWVATGEFPLLRRKIPEGFSTLDEIAALLCHKDVSFVLQENITFSKCAHFLR